MTARDVTGFCFFSPPRNRATFSSHFRAISLLHYTKNLEKKEKIPGENSPQKSNGDGAPKLQISVPCRGRARPEKCVCVIVLNPIVILSHPAREVFFLDRAVLVICVLRSSPTPPSSTPSFPHVLRIRPPCTEVKNPKIGKRGSQSQKPHFPSPQKGRLESKNSHVSHRAPHGKLGFFDSKHPFWGEGKWVF